MKSQNSSIEARIKAGAKSRGEHLRLILQGKELLSKKDVYISISNTHFDVYQIGSMLSVKAYSWLLLKKCYIKDSTLFLEFDSSKICFSSQEIDKAYSLILDILPRILTNNELLSIGISQNQIKSKPNPNSAILRLKLKLKYSANPQQNYLVKEITDLISYNPYNISLDKLKDFQTTIPLFIDILPLLPDVRSLSFSTSPLMDTYRLALDLSNNSGNLEHLEVKGSSTPTFERFLKNLTINKSTKIRNLTFKEALFNEQELTLLLNFVREKRVTSLSLVNSIQQRAMSYFYFNFLQDASISSLLMLSLDRTPGLNLYALFPAISNITFLSMEDCGLDLSKTLSKFAKMKFNNLTALNLSKNQAKDPLLQGTILPPNLTTLLVDDIDWGENCLTSFFTILKENFKNKDLRLSIKRSTAPRSEWNRLFNVFVSLDLTTLKSLIWNKNPIRESFFDFLKQQKDLEYLSLNQCFSDQETVNLSNFCNFLKHSTLKSLSIEGDEDFYLKKSISSVISALKHREPLDYLNIKNSKSGDDGILEMKKFILSNSSPCVLLMDGAEPERSQAILDFLNTAIDLQNDNSVSFPINDLEYLNKLKRITSEKYEEIKNKYRSNEGNDDSLFNTPFFTFIEEENQKFPIYVTREGLKKEDPNNFHDLVSPIRSQENNEKPAKFLSPNKRLFEMSSASDNPENVFQSMQRNRRRHRKDQRPQTYDPEDRKDVFQSKYKRKQPEPLTIDSDGYIPSKTAGNRTNHKHRKPKEPEVIITNHVQTNYAKDKSKFIKNKEQSSSFKLDDSSENIWRQERSDSNIAAVSSQVAFSIDETTTTSDFTFDTFPSFGGTSKPKKSSATNTKQINNRKNSIEKVPRLTPTDAYAQFFLPKRRLLTDLPNNGLNIDDKTKSSSSDIPMNQKVEDDIPTKITKRHKIPPLQIFDSSPTTTTESSAFNTIDNSLLETLDKIEPKAQEKQKIEEKPQDSKVRRKKRRKHTVVKTTQNQENPKQKEINDAYENLYLNEKWLFPILRVKAPEPWTELQLHFSLDENMRAFAKIPHHKI